MLKKISMICATSLLVSCASNQYIIDPKSSTNPENYYADKMECENISEQESYTSNITWGALKSGILGAIVSGGLAYAGLTSGNISVQNSAIIGAGGGIVTGGIFGGSNTYSTRKEIVRKCMEGRGYNILK
tara:strand:- start:135 stop:524 length:390 start_codon:yes stop_codon:yes gene_type:complete